MKRFLKQALDGAAAPKDAIARAVLGGGARQRPAASTDRVLVLPSHAPGSLGDEALVEGLVGEIGRRGGTTAIVEYDARNRWGAAKGIESIDMSHFFHLSRRLAPTAWSAVPEFRRALDRTDRVVMIGADVIDGHYNGARTAQRLALAHWAAQAGVPTSIVSFSFNERPQPRALRALRALPAGVELIAREPLSKQRIERALDRHCRLAADVAFLMRTEQNSATVAGARDWMLDQRGRGRAIVGVNANIEPFRWAGAGTDELVSVHAATVRQLIAERSCACLFVSHDWRAAPREQMLAERIRDSLPPELQAYARVVEGPHSAMEAKGICAELDFLVSGRMHLAIGALTHSVPTVFLPYQGKFEGLTQHLGADELVLDVEHALSKGTLIDQVAPLLERRSELHAEIAARMPQILELSRSNLD